MIWLAILIKYDCISFVIINIYEYYDEILDQILILKKKKIFRENFLNFFFFFDHYSTHVSSFLNITLHKRTRKKNFLLRVNIKIVCEVSVLLMNINLKYYLHWHSLKMYLFATWFIKKLALRSGFLSNYIISKKTRKKQNDTFSYLLFYWCSWGSRHYLSLNRIHNVIGNSYMFTKILI